MNYSTLDSVTDDEKDLFYFESDHLALKGNKDYSEILKTIFILESQRSKAIKDYDKVVELHKQALNDPIKFIQKLKTEDGLQIPDLQNIVEVPMINWSKFNVQIPKIGLKFVRDKGGTAEKLQSPEDFNKTKIKCDTHNKPWTTEEQKRLEELLIVYPPEPIELRRFKKIAAALGNRTVKQVSSRVQKYFLKLYKAGLPIPGRIPKAATRIKKSKLHMHQRYNHYLWKPTTFFPELDIPVAMNDLDDVPGPSIDVKPNLGTVSTSSNYLIANSIAYQDPKQSEYVKSETELQLDILYRVKYEKEKEPFTDVTVQHIGFKCDYCNEEPINGVRWHCETCKQESIDFCTDCVLAQMYSENCHPLSHNLITVRLDGMSSSSENSGFSSDSSGNSDESNKNSEVSDTNSFTKQKDQKYELQNHETYNFNIKTDNQTNFEQMNLKKNITSISVEDNNGYASETDFTYLQNDLTDDYVDDLENNLNDVGNMDIAEDEDSQIYTDTQNISYSYLHSNLIYDENS